MSFLNGLHRESNSSATMGMGALLVLERAKLKDKVAVTSINAINGALQAGKGGGLDATVFQDAKGHGGTAVEPAAKIARKHPHEKETYIPFQLVTKWNAAKPG